MAREVDFVSDLSGFDRNDRQLAAWEAFPKYKQFLYGGAKFGGKSHFLRWAGIGRLIELFAAYGIRDMRAMLACETYPTLYDRQISKILTDPKIRLVGRWMAGTKELRLHPRFGSGVLCLRNLDDPSKYNSAEFVWIGVDEATKNPPGMRDDLVSLLRWPGVPSSDCVLCMGSNPGGIGHADLQRVFIRRQFRDNERPGDYGFLRAFAADNPYCDEAYLNTLRGLPDKLRRAYLDGDWDVFEGQVFSEWDPAVHVVEPFEVPEGWRRTGGIDYGYSPGYSAVLWFATDPYDGWAYCYRELYRQEMTPDQLAAEVIRLSGSEQVTWVADPSLWARNPQTGLTSAEVMETAGLSIAKANNDRVDGWRMMHEWLALAPAPWPAYLLGGEPETEVPQPKLRFFGTCPEAIRTIPTLSYDDRPAAVATNVEDARKGGEDHLADACRYWCATDAPALLAPTGIQVVDALPW